MMQHSTSLDEGPKNLDMFKQPLAGHWSAALSSVLKEPALAIDSSAAALMCCLWVPGQEPYQLTIGGHGHYGEAIVPLIAAILADADLKPKDLAMLCVGQGPGSYTGLRVGMAALKGLAFGLKVPLLPFCSLRAVAMGSGAQRCLTVLDARAGQLAIAGYGIHTEALVIEQIYPLKLVAKELGAAVVAKLILDDAAHRWQLVCPQEEHIRADLATSLHQPIARVYPWAAYGLLAGQAQRAQGHIPSLHGVLPHYGRDPLPAVFKLTSQ